MFRWHNCSVTFGASDNCTTDSCTVNFSVTTATAVNVDGPADEVYECLCTFADQAALDVVFNTWLSQFVVVEEGCVDTSDAVFNQIPLSPSLCNIGFDSTVTLTFSLTDSCSTDSITSSFTSIRNRADCGDVSRRYDSE